MAKKLKDAFEKDFYVHHCLAHRTEVRYHGIFLNSCGNSFSLLYFQLIFGNAMKNYEAFRQVEKKAAKLYRYEFFFIMIFDSQN